MIAKIIFIKIFIIFCSAYPQTPNQIKKAKEFIKKTGMSEAQVRSEAKARGYTDKQINKVVEKEKNLNQGQGSIDIPFKEEVPTGNSTQDAILLPDFSENKKLETFETEKLELIQEEEINIDSKIENKVDVSSFFGYDIFKRDPALFQSTSVGLVDPNYLIGPGDELIIMLWGETEFRQVFKVNKEGFIFVSDIGQIFVNGLNLTLLESKLFRVFSQAYASLNPPNGRATTFLDVSLGNLRPLRIQVLGEVAQPGAYTVSPSATLFSSLYFFNGPTFLGSLRDIRLIRNNKKVTSIDFYDFLLTGKKPKDQKLQLDDVIFIPKRMKTVSIGGEIERPGIYEMMEGETFDDLVSFAGGLKVSAYLNRAQIDRIVPFAQRDSLQMDRMFIDIDIGELLELNRPFQLQDGDNIQIFSILDLRQNTVEVRGAVTRPGSYDIGDSLNLKELILKADSLVGDAYLDRVDIIRTKGDFTEELIKLDLNKALEQNADHNISLQGFDIVKVYSKTEMISKKYVSIIGYVKQEGRYQLRDNMTLYDLIFMAGGFMDESHKAKAYLKRAELLRFADGGDKREIIPFNLGLVLEKKDIASILLKADDEIRIYSKAEIKGEKRFVSISGHVKNQGKYELIEKNMKIYDLLFKSGGLNDNLWRSNAFLERADLIRFNEDRITKKVIPFNLGQVLENKLSDYNYLLKPGDEIRIYSKKVFNEVKSVSIQGAIRNPGNYNYKIDMTLKDLILESGGVSLDVYRYKVEVARIDPEPKDIDIFANSYLFDMTNDYKLFVEKDDERGDLDNGGFILKPYDYISIRPDPYFSMQKTIQVDGSVYYPGEYIILNPKETIFDIIKRSGGLKPQAYASASQFIRNGKSINIDLSKIVRSPKSKQNIKVRDGDQIVIANTPNMIEIVGEINVPGFYRYQKGQRVRSAIKKAGGYTPDALKNDIYIRFPDGKSKKYGGLINNPKIMDGSIITVGKKPEEEPFDATEYFKDLTSILANFVQAISIFVLANQ